MCVFLLFLTFTQIPDVVLKHFQTAVALECGVGLELGNQR